VNKKELTSKQLIIIMCVFFLVGAIVFNQLILQYLVAKYGKYTIFSSFFDPIKSYSLNIWFITRNKLLNNGFMGAGELIFAATIIGGLLLMVLFIFLCRLIYKEDLASDRYGTAQFEDNKVILQSEKVDNPETEESLRRHGRYGLFMGSIECSSTVAGSEAITWEENYKKLYLNLRLIYHFGSQHMLLFAPTGSGKGVGLVLPILVTYPSSVFVYDLKGENYELTAGYRNKVFNNVIIKFEPSDGSGASARYNPMAEIRIGTIYEVADAQKLAMALLDQDGKGLHDHWLRKAYDLLTGVILHVCYTKKQNNLTGVALFLSGVDPDTKLPYPSELAWLKEMSGQCPSSSGKYHYEGYADMMGITSEEALTHLAKLNLVDKNGVNTIVKSSAIPLIAKADKAAGERSSIISTADGPLSLYKDPVVAANTSCSDFKLNDIQNFDRPVSFYFIVPNDQRDRLKPLVRLFITQLINNIQSSMDKKVRELAMLLDEVAELGKIESMESALATIRGYQVRMILILQDYLQLAKSYGENQTIFSNCGVRIAYAPNEIKTAEMLAKYTGVMTYVEKETSKSVNNQAWSLFSSSGSESTSVQKTQRQLMTADEVTRLGDDMIILIEKRNPIRGHKWRWFSSPFFQQRIYNSKTPSLAKYAPPKASHRISRKTSQKESESK